MIAYCRIGERSSHTWFVLTYLLGYPNVRNYDGSWTEWGSMVNVPIEKSVLGDSVGVRGERDASPHRLAPQARAGSEPWTARNTSSTSSTTTRTRGNKGRMEDADVQLGGGNPGCGDLITIYLKVGDDDRIDGGHLRGRGLHHQPGRRLDHRRDDRRA